MRTAPLLCCLPHHMQYGGFTLPLAYGRGILGLKVGPLSEREPLTTVVGAPISLPSFDGGQAVLVRASLGCRVAQSKGCSAAATGRHTSSRLPCPAHPAGDLRGEAGRAHVDACHALYCAALQKLYDEHKEQYAPNRTRDLRFVE